MKRINDTVEQNPAVKTLKRNQRIQRQSPPQRDLNTFGPSENTLPTHDSGRKLLQYNSGRSYQYSENGSNHKRQHSLGSGAIIGGGVIGMNETFTHDNSNFIHKPQQHSMKKKKSPVPLRRRLDETSQSLAENHEKVI